jgi:hypothetical protein
MLDAALVVMGDRLGLCGLRRGLGAGAGSVPIREVAHTVGCLRRGLETPFGLRLEAGP